MRRDIGNEVIVAIAVVAVLAFAVTFGILLSGTDPAPLVPTSTPTFLIFTLPGTSIAAVTPTAAAEVTQVPELTEDVPTDVVGEPTTAEPLTPTQRPVIATTTGRTPIPPAITRAAPQTTRTPEATPDTSLSPQSFGTGQVGDFPPDELISPDAPVVTQTDTATSTATATRTGTSTRTPTATQTRMATATLSATATSTSTSTWTATATLTMTASATATATLTVTTPFTATAAPTATSTRTATATATAAATLTQTPTDLPTVTATFLPTATVAQTRTLIPEETPVILPTPTPAPGQMAEYSPEATESPVEGCELPPGWIVYIARQGDTLTGLAADLGLSVDDLLAGNCRAAAEPLILGDVLFLPSLPAGEEPVPIPDPEATPEVEATLGCDSPIVQIVVPQTNQTVSGNFRVFGTAVGEETGRYELQLRADAAYRYETQISSPPLVIDAQLGQVDTRDLDAGRYWLRLVVFTADDVVINGAVCALPLVVE